MTRRAPLRSRSGLSRRDFLKYSGAGIASATILGACSDVVTGFTGGESTPPGTVVFSFGPDATGALTALVDDFNKTNGKGITVEYREMPADSGQYFDKLRTEFQAGGGDIDVMGGDVIWPAQFGPNGWIEDLSDLFTEEMQSNYLDGPLEANRWEGKIYGVPWFSDAGLLYYRKDLLEKSGFKEPPKSWDELKSMCTKVQEDSGTRYGMVFQGAEYEGGVCNGMEHVWNAGSDALDPNDPTKVIIGSGEAAKGLEIERSLVEEGFTPTSVSTYKELESQTAFIQGDSVFMRNWPFVYGTILGGAAAGSEIKPEQTGIALLPVVNEGEESFAALGGWNFFINSVSDKKEQAWEFILYMSDEASMKDAAINDARMPPLKSLYEDEQLLKDQPIVPLVKDSLTRARSRPRHPFYSDMSLVLAERFTENLKGDAETSQIVADMQTDLQRIADIGEDAYNL